MIRRVGQIIRGLAALCLVVGIVFGIPAALIVLVGWPLPTAWPSLEQLRQFTQTGVAETTIIKTLAVIVWVAWFQLALAIIFELVAHARSRAVATLPLVPGLQPLAAQLVAATALLTTATTSPRTSAAMPLGALVAAAPASAPVDPGHAPDTTSGGEDPAPGSQTRPSTTTITATPRDSWWGLAERHLGDGMRWREIRDLNMGRSVADGVVIDASSDQLQPGWRLHVPASDATPPTHTPPPPEQGQWGEWRVRKGDHFWGIAEQTLVATWGRQPNDQEVVPYWQQLVDANHDRLLPPRNPDLIYPDQQFATPPPPANPTAEAVEPAHPEPEPQAAPPLGEPAPSPDAALDRDPAQAGSHVTPEGAATTQDGSQAAVVSDPELSVTTGEEPSEPDGHEPRTGLGLPVGLISGVAASGLLAAGVVAALRLRRRTALQRRTPGLRLPTPLPETEAEVTRLEAAAVPESTLDDLANLLSSIPSDAHPVLITADDDGAVTLLFDDTMTVPAPPPPWTLADDGSHGPVGWRATIGDRGPERSIGLPLLVTLGRTASTTVLANVAALHHLTVTGPQPEIRRRLRAMSLEVATSRVSVPVEVAVAGDELLASLDRVRHVDNPVAEVEAAVVELEQGVILEDRTPRLLVCHDNVVPPHLPEELTGMVGVLSAQETEAGLWLLEVQDERIARLRLPDSGTVELALPEIDPQLVDHELTRLDHGASVEAASLEAAETTPTPADPSTNGYRPVGRANTTEPAWCEVRLLGPVEVVRDSMRVEGLTPRTLEVLTYLVTHRDGVTKERLDDAIWAGRAPRTSSQRVTAAITKLRDILGDGPDSQPLVPRRTGAEPIRLSQHVGCDLDRAFEHLAVARHLPAELRTRELTAALELVRGEPFQDLPVSWGTEITQRAIIQLQDAALDAARVYRDAGAFHAAESAIRQGLLLLDPADALYLERAELEKARGHPERVAQIWQQLRHRHGQDADEIAGYVSAPAPEIELAFQNLMGSA